MKYIRLYDKNCGGVSVPTRFWNVAWCKPDELLEAITNGGWAIDRHNLFGIKGKHPRDVPAQVVSTGVANP